MKHWVCSYRLLGKPRRSTLMLADTEDDCFKKLIRRLPGRFRLVEFSTTEVGAKVYFDSEDDRLN